MTEQEAFKKLKSFVFENINKWNTKKDCEISHVPDNYLIEWYYWKGSFINEEPRKLRTGSLFNVLTCISNEYSWFYQFNPQFNFPVKFDQDKCQHYIVVEITYSTDERRNYLIRITQVFTT
ncbi:MAG: hypothetical protein ACK5OS_02000 [Chryseotalea sp.]